LVIGGVKIQQENKNLKNEPLQPLQLQPQEDLDDINNMLEQDAILSLLNIS
jgi:hypothetical protein